MNELAVSLWKKWNDKYGAEFFSDFRREKKIKFPGFEVAFSIIYSKHIESWQKHPARTNYSSDKCFFCEGRDESHNLEEVLRVSHLRAWQSLKYAEPCHFLISDPTSHRENITTDDVIILHKLAKESGLSIFGNFRGSGASFPWHFHYQSLGTIFPIAMAGFENSQVINRVDVAKLRYPVAAYRFYPIGEEGRRTVAEVISNLPGAYNPLFFGAEIFIVPRIKSVPSNTNGFKFAASEIFGRIYARSKKAYMDFNRKIVNSALNEVCIEVEGLQTKIFERKLHELLEKGNDNI